MADAFWELKKLAQDAIGKRLDGIPGVVLPGVFATGNQRYAKLTTTFLGWSPSLHAIKFEMTTHHELVEKNDRERDIDIVLEEYLKVFDSPVAIQRERAAAARDLGTDTHLDLKEISHLQADVAWPILKAARGDDPRTSFGEALRRAHSEATTGGRQLRASGVHVAEGKADNGAIVRAVLPHLRFQGSDGRRMVTWRGFDLEIHADPPTAAILAVMPGRRLGNIVSLHPIFDDRVIESVRDGRKTKPSFIVRTQIDTDPAEELLAQTEA